MCKCDAFCIYSHAKEMPRKWRGKTATGSQYVNIVISLKVFCFLSGYSCLEFELLSKTLQMDILLVP